MSEREVLVIDEITESGILVAKKPLTVVKIGGTELSQATDVVAGIHQEGKNDLILVHGGGEQISRKQQAAGIETRWAEDGSRVTDARTRDIVVEVLDEENEKLTNALSDNGVPAVGYNSMAGLIEGEPVSRDNLVASPNTLKLDGSRLKSDLYEEGTWPVIAPIALSTRQGSLNVNGDSAAGAVAVEMRSPIVFVTRAGGVRREGKIVPEINRETHQALRGAGVVKGGMDYKVGEALRVGGGIIVDFGNLRGAIKGEPVGTRVRR